MEIERGLRTAIYLRISRDFTGEGLGVDRQRSDCERIAKQRGWTVVETYVDNNLSASDRTKSRPAYERMVRNYEAGLFDAIICWDLDRLTRQPRQLEDWIDAAQDRGLKLVTANGEADLSTDGGRMYARIKASVARAEVERKGARQRAANEQRAAQGKPNLGVRLYGYETNGDTREEEAKHARVIFARFAAGDSLRSIAADLTAQGIPTRRGGKWNPTTIRGILVNPRYAGLVKYQGEITGTRGDWEAFVSEDVWRSIQTTLADPRRRSHQGTDRKYLGSGLFLCDTCDQRLVSLSSPSKKQSARYHCRNCNMSRTQSAVNDYVVAIVRAYLEREQIGAHLTARTQENEQPLLEESDRLRARIAQIAADYDDGLIDAHRFREATQKAQATLDRLFVENTRDSGGEAITGVMTAINPGEAFDSAPLMVRRAVIDYLLEVRLLRHKQGIKAFDPGTVKIVWKGQGK